MEVFDRLLCAFAQDALDSFYLSTRTCRSRADLKRAGMFLALVAFVTAAHALLLFVHLTTLNVVVNANEDAALFALLVSNNFSEIKSTVFKKYDAAERKACSLVLALLRTSRGRHQHIPALQE